MNKTISRVALMSGVFGAMLSGAAAPEAKAANVDTATLVAPSANANIEAMRAFAKVAMKKLESMRMGILRA